MDQRRRQTVQILERVEHLERYSSDLTYAQRAASGNFRLQALAAYVLLDQIAAVVFVKVVIDLDDVNVAERGENLGLAAEHLLAFGHRLLGARRRGQFSQRAKPVVQAQVGRQVHQLLAAAADFTLDPVAARYHPAAARGSRRGRRCGSRRGAQRVAAGIAVGAAIEVVKAAFGALNHYDSGQVAMIWRAAGKRQHGRSAPIITSSPPRVNSRPSRSPGPVARWARGS